MKTTCSRCHGPNERFPERRCRTCHAAYQREWRARRPVPEKERAKLRVRCYTAYYRRTGRLKPTPCERCGDPNVETHHPDYARPLEVTWLCRCCHLALHSEQRATARLTPGI